MDNYFQIPWTRYKLNRVFSFLKLLRVEPYLFLLSFQSSLKVTPSSQLLEDKICRNWYNGTIDYCRYLPQSKEVGNGPGHYKSRILADVNQLGTYTTYVSTVPALIWTLFVGAWIDRYVKGRKQLMLFGVGAAIIENLITIYLSLNFDTSVYYNILLNLPTSLCGGTIASKIAITHYMTSTTPPKLMAMRFMIYEMCMLIGHPIGSSLGGYLLVQDPIFHTGEIRNYTLCFIIALGFELIAFLWIVFMVNETVARKEEMKIQMKIRGIRDSVGAESTKIKLRSDMSREDESRHPLKLLFDFENVKSMVRTCIKKRPNRARTQLFILFVCIIIKIMSVTGASHIMNQFIQKVYFWAPDWTSYMNSLNMVIHSIATITIVPFLIKVLKFTDIPLGIIGFISLFARDILIGTWLNPIANYISIPINAVDGMSTIGIRSHITKIVGRDEIGKVISFMAALDTLAPMFSSTAFTYIYNNTMDTCPGLVYQIIAFMILIPIYMFMWIDLFTQAPVIDEHNKQGKRVDIHLNSGCLNECERLEECSGKNYGRYRKHRHSPDNEGHRQHRNHHRSGETINTCTVNEQGIDDHGNSNKDVIITNSEMSTKL